MLIILTFVRRLLSYVPLAVMLRFCTYATDANYLYESVKSWINADAPIFAVSVQVRISIRRMVRFDADDLYRMNLR